MPRLMSIGLPPAVTALTPSRKIAWASTVAVVVPSPATSDVLLATSRTSWAPMFSGSSSSISLATETPSLVDSGEPNFFSSTTLRPLGPSDDPEDLVLADDDVLGVVDLDLGAGVLAEQHGVTDLDLERSTRSPFSIRPEPTAMTLPSIGFSFAVSGMMIPPFFCSFSLDPLEQDPVIQRLHFHGSKPPLFPSCCEFKVLFFSSLRPIVQHS